MKPRYIKLLIGIGIFIVVLGVYLYSGAPTLSFWDCGELIACSYIVGIPHPPGTPLFVLIGKIFTFFPIAKEIAFRTNFLTMFFGAISCVLLYLIIFKLISLQKSTQSIRQRYPFLPHVAAIAGALALAFAFSYWDNCVETEVYTPCVDAALLVIYLALMWRNKVEQGIGDNRTVLFAIFLLFLSAGIHFTTMMVLFPLLVFAFLVDRKSILQLHIFELLILFLMIVIVAGFDLIGYFVLFLASPSVALMQILHTHAFLFLVFVAIYGGYLYYLHTKRKLDSRYVFWGLVLIFLAGTVQLYLLVRSRLNPAIDEVNPANWKDFVSVLMREQYDPMKIYPRKTQFFTEADYRNFPNSYPAYSLIVGYLRQIEFYVRYFLWQWSGEKNLNVFIFSNLKFSTIRWQALIGILPIILGFYGIVDHFKRDRKSWWLIFLCFFIASIGLLTYLNPKYSPSDPHQELQYREVRERDYFYAFSFMFFAIFIGLGINAFLEWIIPRLKYKKLRIQAVSGLCIILVLVPIAFNYSSITRRGDWIPAEYGYNMLISCGDGKSIIFTNGDNDTFPLWCVQCIPTRTANYDPKFGKNVAVANLSLLNTNWYVKQLKEWGAPISFSESEIDQLPQGFMGKNRRSFLLKDIMVRDIIATNAGIKLKWPDDYASTADEFMVKVMDNYKEGMMPVYFATTVDRGENLTDVEPYLRLEGLVNRVTNVKQLGQIDLARTQQLFSMYKTTSMFDLKVAKDENTKGLFLNYIASYAALSQEYYKIGQLDSAISVLKRTLQFDIDPTRKVPVYYNLSMYAMLKQDYVQALSYLDAVEKMGLSDADLLVRRGWVYQSQGNYGEAEKAFQAARVQSPMKPEPVQSLVSLYTEYMRDTSKAKAVLQEWLQRNPNDATAKQMLQSMEAPQVQLQPKK